MTYYTLMFRIKLRCLLALRHSSPSALPPKGAGAESQWTVAPLSPTRSSMGGGGGGGGGKTVCLKLTLHCQLEGTSELFL